MGRIYYLPASGRIIGACQEADVTRMDTTTMSIHSFMDVAEDTAEKRAWLRDIIRTANRVNSDGVGKYVIMGGAVIKTAQWVDVHEASNG